MIARRYQNKRAADEAAPVDSWRREEAKPVYRRYLVCGHTPLSYAWAHDSDVIQITQF